MSIFAKRSRLICAIFRGARCHPDQIIITAGTQQAMMISAMALVNRGEVAWIEDPGILPGAPRFGFAGATVVPRPSTGKGSPSGEPSKTIALQK